MVGFRKVFARYARLVFLGALTLNAGARAETVRQTENIGGYTYTVEYKVGTDGNLAVQPTHIMTSHGWMQIGSPGAPRMALAPNTNTSRVVNVGGKEYSVRFNDDGQLRGEAYAVKTGADWDYLSQTSSTATGATPSVQMAKDKQKAAVSLAEFRMYDSMVRRFEVDALETTAFIKNGNPVNPRVNIKVRPQISDSENSIALNVNVTVNGTATSTGSQARQRKVFRRRPDPVTGATVTSQVTGNFNQEVRATANGITSGPMADKIKTTYQVQTFTSEGIFAGAAHKRASAMAHDNARAGIPEEEQKLRESIASSTMQAISDGNGVLRKNIEQLSGFGPGFNDAIMDLRFSSKAPRPGARGYVQASLAGESTGKISPRPQLKDDGKNVAELFIHEEAFRQSVAPHLAGKTINIKDAIAAICKNPYREKLDFCVKPKVLKPGEKPPANVTLIFDKTNPFEVLFRDGKLTLVLNATHKDEKQTGTPNRVEIVYTVTPTGLIREKVVATPYDPPKEENLAKDEKKKTEQEHAVEATTNLFNGVFNFANRTLGVEKGKLEKAYSEEFKERVDFTPVRLPATAFVNNPKMQPPGAKPTITSYIDLLPLEAKAEDGWFALSSQLK